MPATSDAPRPLELAYLAQRLAALARGPHDDLDTASAAGLAAEAIRYLNHAVPRDGITVPATAYTVTGHLREAASRLPQLLTALGHWLAAETAAGRTGDDHARPPAETVAQIQAAYSRAADHADGLTDALDTAHELAATLRAVRPPAPAA
jgi:hypothetical protein